MSSAEERLKILNMIAESRISPEEGVKLLNALRESSPRRPADGQAQGKARQLRVRITSLDTGKVKVDINLPISLIDVGVRMGARFAPELEGLDYEEIMEAIQRGVRGKVIDLEDEDGGERVEVFVD